MSDDSTRSTWDPKLFLVSPLPNYISSTHSHFPPARRLLHQYPSTRVNQTLTIQRLLSWWQMATEKITPDSKNLCSLHCQTLYERLINLTGWFQPPHGCKEVAWNAKILCKVLLVLSGWYTVLISTLRNFLKHPKLLPTILMHLDAQITCIARDRQGLPEWKGSSKSFKFHWFSQESQPETIHPKKLPFWVLVLKKSRPKIPQGWTLWDLRSQSLRVSNQPKAQHLLVRQTSELREVPWRIKNHSFNQLG